MPHLEPLRSLLAIGLLIALATPCRRVADVRFERIDPEAAGGSPEGLAELETFLGPVFAARRSSPQPTVAETDSGAKP